MLKFGTTKLANGVVHVNGPTTVGPKAKIRHLRFVIAQGDVMIESAARPGASGWMGKAKAPGLKKGIAYGCGMAVIQEMNTPPTIETFTWAEVIKVT